MCARTRVRACSPSPAPPSQFNSNYIWKMTRGACVQELERMIGNREVIISTTVNKIDEVSIWNGITSGWAFGDNWLTSEQDVPPYERMSWSPFCIHWCGAGGGGGSGIIFQLFKVYRFQYFNFCNCLFCFSIISSIKVSQFNRKGCKRWNEAIIDWRDKESTNPHLSPLQDAADQ